jgi:hypothetical protein
MINRKDMINAVSEKFSMEELAVLLIKKEFEVTDVAYTNQPVEVTHFGSGWSEYVPSLVSEIVTTVRLKDGTKITIEKEVMTK